MKLKEIMSKYVQTIDADTTLQKAGELMRDCDVGALPVMENDKAIGFVTDRDIAIRAIANGKDPKMTKVREAMTGGITSCSEECGLEEAADMMKTNRIRRLLVNDAMGKPAGMISLGDLALHSHDLILSESVLEEVSRPQ